jgi:hypothetical protein
MPQKSRHEEEEEVMGWDATEEDQNEGEEDEDEGRAPVDANAKMRAMGMRATMGNSSMVRFLKRAADNDEYEGTQRPAKRARTGTVIMNEGANLAKRRRGRPPRPIDPLREVCKSAHYPGKILIASHRRRQLAPAV